MRNARSSLLSLLVLVVSVFALPGALHGQAPDPDRYIVKFVDAGRGRAALASAGAAVLLDLPEVNAAAARIPLPALAALAANPNIEYIERDVPRYPLAQTAPYGIGMVQADQVSDGAAGNRKVCIIDSGYSRGHEDLPSSTSLVRGTNNSGTGNWYVDACGHGTHVAGTIAALNNTVGVVGVLPSGLLNLHIIKVFGDNCSWAYSSTLVNAAYACRDAGANVISMSLGCNGMWCRSTTEENAFNDLYNNSGILAVAAAGNSGNTQLSYPASYNAVISVAAVDSARTLASFSQRNSQVELAAPGAAVRSTVPMGNGTDESLVVGATGYEVVGMQGSPNATGTGQLVDCGLATSTCTGAAGKVCLIQRGTNSFAEKVVNCQNGGGVGAVIYNNAAPLFSGTLGSTVTTIPSVGTAGTTGAILLGRLGQSATVTVGPGNYAFLDGTSMATPHVSGVAALVWSHNPSWTNQQIRTALAVTAEDLGAAGRDNSYGWGLVQAKAALDYLSGDSEPPPDEEEPPPSDDPIAPIALSATGYKVKGVNTVDLSWAGATSANVDIVRNGSLTTVANTGAYTDSIGTKGKGSFTYQVCEAGTSICSNSVTIVF